VRYLNEYRMLEGDDFQQVFGTTLYREPTAEELEEFENFTDITPEDVLENFHYISVGKGIFSEKHKRQIVDWIGKLCDAYPKNETYRRALDMARSEKPRFR